MHLALSTLRHNTAKAPALGVLLGLGLAAMASLPAMAQGVTDCASDVQQDGACFVVARNPQGLPLACAAIRPGGQQVAELKRMYARMQANPRMAGIILVNALKKLINKSRKRKVDQVATGFAPEIPKLNEAGTEAKETADRNTEQDAQESLDDALLREGEKTLDEDIFEVHASSNENISLI